VILHRAEEILAKLGLPDDRRKDERLTTRFCFRIDFGSGIASINCQYVHKAILEPCGSPPLLELNCDCCVSDTQLYAMRGVVLSAKRISSGNNLQYKP